MDSSVRLLEPLVALMEPSVGLIEASVVSTVKLSMVCDQCHRSDVIALLLECSSFKVRCLFQHSHRKTLIVVAACGPYYKSYTIVIYDIGVVIFMLQILAKQFTTLES